MLRAAGAEVVAYTHLRNISLPCCTCCGNLTQFSQWVDTVTAAASFDGVFLDNMDTLWSSPGYDHRLDGYHQMVRPCISPLCVELFHSLHLSFTLRPCC